MKKDKRKYLFIINPFAGVDSKDRLPQLIAERLPTDRYDCSIQHTEYAGHATIIARQQKNNGYDAIIAVGGDGTVNEVAAGLIHSETPMGIIPGGSGNGLAMHLGIGRNARRALRLLGDPKIKQIDTVQMNDRFFLNMAGVGIDGLVAYKTKHSTKRGFGTYFRGAIIESVKYQNRRYTVDIDGQTYTGRFLSVNIANGSMFGYHFKVAAKANTEDGLLDAVIIHDAKKRSYFGNAWRFWAGTMHRSKLATSDRAPVITLTTHDNTFMHIDGEGYPCEPGTFEFRVLPKSLNVIC